MDEMELFTLKEISELLGVKYRSLLSCKDYFADLASGSFDGRHVRYPVEYVGFFAKVFDLKQPGYTFELVRQILIQKGYLSHNGQLTSLLEEEARKSITGARTSTQEHAGQRTSTEENGGERRMTDEAGGARWMTEDDGGGRTITEEHGGARRRHDEHGGAPRMADDDGGGKTTEKPGGQSGIFEQEADKGEEGQVERIREQLVAEFQHMAEAQIERTVREHMAQLAGWAEEQLADISSQVNASMTQIYKAVQGLQGGLAVIDQRLQKLETDLGVEASAVPELVELDLEQLQIVRAKAEAVQEQPAGSHADLGFVRASIRDGKPDRDAVAQWIVAQRSQEPDLSYGELAERLDQAGIPTLRGLEGWNRGVVRNLAMRGKENGG